MTLQPTLLDLQVSVQDKAAFKRLEDYFTISYAFLSLLADVQPTRIVAPNDHRYIFYQYDKQYGHKITRPLNANLFMESADTLQTAFQRVLTFLADLKKREAQPRINLLSSVI